MTVSFQHVCDLVLMRHFKPLQWLYNERDGVSNHRRLICLLNRLFRCASKETSKLRVTGLLWGEFTCDRWIPLTKVQWRGKCFHLMTSSWPTKAVHNGTGLYFDEITPSVFSVPKRDNSLFDCTLSEQELDDSLYQFWSTNLLSYKHC